MQNEKQAVDILVPMSGKGGVETVINQVAGYLKTRGYRVRVVQMVFEGPIWLDAGIDFYPLRHEKVRDITDFAPMYAQFLEQTYVPDLVIATPWPYMTLTAKKALAQVSKAPVKIIAWLHAPLTIYRKYGVGGAECLGFADRVFVLNERSRAQLNNLLPRADVRLVCNPVDFSACHPVHPSEEHCLLFVGRLSEEKGVSVLLDAIARCKNLWQLKVIGDGDQREALERQAEQLEIADRVDFLGWQKHPWEFAPKACALLMASEYEAFPLTAIEAMACGLPVFSTPVDGMIELIRPGENGFLYEKGQSSELAELLDLYADGELPKIDPEICRASVSPYEAAHALSDLERHIADVFDKISVIIPCYNVASFLPRCLERILEQQTQGVNVEVICVDDKSTDDTLNVLLEWEARFPEQMLVIPLEENGKQGRARNIALQYATGNYVTYADADDLIEPEYLQRLYDVICEYGCDFVGCGYKMRVGQKEIDVPIVNETVCFNFEHCVSDLQRYLMQCGWKTSPWGRLYRTAFLRENDIFFAEDIFMEDILFSSLCLKYAKTYVHIPELLYVYDYNPNGTMAGEKLREYFLDTAIVMNQAVDELLSCDRFQECMDELAYVYFSKAFAEPVSRMWDDASFFSYEAYCILKENVRKRFPLLDDNVYLKTTDDAQLRLAFSFYTAPISTEEELRNIMGV